MQIRDTACASYKIEAVGIIKLFLMQFNKQRYKSRFFKAIELNLSDVIEQR